MLPRPAEHPDRQVLNKIGCGDGVERHALAISPDIYTRQSKTMLRARPNTKPLGV